MLFPLYHRLYFRIQIGYEDIHSRYYQEATELERVAEMNTLIAELRVDTPFTLLANTVSNPVPLTGVMPRDRQYLLRETGRIKDQLMRMT